MNFKLPLYAILVAFATFPPISTAKPNGELITITASEPMETISAATVHELGCPDRQYRLRISRRPARIEFESSRERNLVAISSSTLLNALLRGSLHGSVRMSCPGTGMYIHFIGFDFVKGRRPAPVSYELVIGDNGDVLEDSGPVKMKERDALLMLGRSPQ